MSDLPEAVAPEGFRSGVVERYQRRSHQQQQLFSRLYLEGLSSGGFEPVVRELLGGQAPLSASTILRLRVDWEDEYAAWRQRPLAEHRYAYVWFDGVYVGCGQEREKTVLLCVLGAREDGKKELLALEEGYRESTASWAGVLRSLRERGLRAPLLAVGDGALGAWAALDEVFPETRRQRCWNHRVLNVQVQVPRRLQPEVRRRLRELWEAETRVECEGRRDLVVAWLREEGQERAARPCCATGRTSSASTTSRGSTGCTFGRRTRSSRSSRECGSGPGWRSECNGGRTRSILSSRSSNGWARTGGRSMGGAP